MSGINGCWHLAVNVCLAVMNPVEDVCPPLKGDALQKAKLNKNVHILTRRAQKMQSLKVHKIENFFDSDFGICVISLLVISKH